MTNTEEKEKAKQDWIEKHDSMRGFELVWKKQHPEELKEIAEKSADMLRNASDEELDEFSEATDDDVVAVVVPEAKVELGVDDVSELGNSEEHVEVVEEDFELFWNTTGLRTVQHGHSIKSILQKTLLLSRNKCSYSDFVQSIGADKFRMMVGATGRNNPTSVNAIKELAKLAWNCSPK